MTSISLKQSPQQKSSSIGIDKKLIGPYKRVLDAILSTSREVPTRVQRQLDGHLDRVNGRLRRFQTAEQNRKKLESEFESKRTIYEDQIIQRNNRSAELKERNNKARVELAKGMLKHHFDLIEKRQRERDFLDYQQKLPKAAESESERSWKPEQKKITEPQQDNLEGMNTTVPTTRRRRLPTYQMACEMKQSIWLDEYNRGQLQSSEIARRTQRAQLSHEKALNQKREKVAHLDSKIREIFQKQQAQHEIELQKKVTGFMTKLERYKHRKDSQYKDLSAYLKNRISRDGERIRAVHENLSRIQVEDQERTMRLTDQLFRTRVRSVSFGTRSLYTKNSSEHIMRQAEIESSKAQRQGKILLKHQRATEKNYVYKNLMNKIQDTGNLYNYSTSHGWYE